MSIIDELNNQNTWFDYDTMGNLTGASYNDTEKLFRVPDAIGNLYKTANRSDRTYDKGGKLLQADKVRYHYDDEGNLIEKASSKGERWEYTWNANGSLHTVQRPDRGLVSFEYDALGRRTAKVYKDKVTRWVWDGNTPLHEWKYNLSDRPKVVSDIAGIKSKDKAEPIENLITWVFEEGSFRPTAKLTDKKSYSIITDYLGTPSQMYDDRGKLTWQGELDIYGKLRNFEGSSPTACPFRYQGQYEDQETGLYYNRFRYYSPDEGMYISQDPIGLAGNNPTLYSYTQNLNIELDPFGLDPIMVDPNDINFSQTTINKNFDIPSDVAESLGKTKNKVNIDSYANIIKKSGADEVMEGMKPIRVVEVKGQYVVRDGNSRLYLARKSKASTIPIEIVTDIDELKEFNSRLKRNGLPNEGTNKLPKCK